MKKQKSPAIERVIIVHEDGSCKSVDKVALAYIAGDDGDEMELNYQFANIDSVEILGMCEGFLQISKEILDRKFKCR